KKPLRRKARTVCLIRRNSSISCVTQEKGSVEKAAELPPASCSCRDAFVPLDGAAQTLAEIDLWLIPQQLFGPLDVCQRVLDVPCPRLGIGRLALVTDQLAKDGEGLVQRASCRRSQVHHLPGNLLRWRRSSQQVPRPNTFSVASTQHTFVDTGSSTERGTEARAASWKTTSTPSQAFAQTFGSARSPSRNSMASIPIRFSRLPVIKLSTPRTVSPRAKSAAAIERPMKPAAPVTKYLANFPLQRSGCARPKAKTALLRILMGARRVPKCATPLSITIVTMATTSAACLAQIKQKVESREARIGIIGMGYVGLP